MNTAEIIDMDLAARGIAKVGGKAVFIPGTVLGDTVEYTTVKKNKRYDIGELRGITAPSRERVDADCAAYPECGGCTFRHVSRALELDVKRRAVESAFRRSGLPGISVCRIIDAGWERYRNKAVFHLTSDGKYGFKSSCGSDVTEVSDCRLVPEIFCRITAAIAKFCKRSKIDAPRSVMLRIGDGGEIMAVLEGEHDACTSLAELLCAEFDHVKSVWSCIGYPTASATEYRHIFGERTISQTVGGVSFRISPSSFFQVNSAVFKQVCDVICDYLDPPDGALVLDLYCGTGAIGMACAKRFPKTEVIGVEINPDAVVDAKATATSAGIGNITFEAGDAGRISHKEAPFAVIVDPPRFGLTDTTIRLILELAPERVIYMSCNPSTLGGDAAKLAAGGYAVSDCTAADMFPRTGHVECVTLFTKQVGR